MMQSPIVTVAHENLRGWQWIAIKTLHAFHL